MTDEIEGHPDAQVRVVRGELIGQVFRVTTQQVVGRGDGAAIRLDDSRVSRVHARFDLGVDGLTLTDLGSANGTFVNGQRIGALTVLALGDLVRFGGSTLRVDRLDLPATHPAQTGPVLFPPLAHLTIEEPAPEVAVAVAAAPTPISEPDVFPTPAAVPVLPIPPPPPFGPPAASIPDATRELPVMSSAVPPRRSRSLVLAIAAAVVVVGFIGGVAAVLATQSDDPAAENATSAGDSGSSASTTTSVVQATTAPLATAPTVTLPYSAGNCIAPGDKPGDSATVVACSAPEALTKVTDIRAGSDLTCATGSTRTSVERTKDGVKTSYVYCSIRVPERDGQLDVGSCLLGKTTSAGKLDVDERNCADAQANYRVSSAVEPGAACPAATSTSIEKSGDESARTSSGKWCLVLLAGRAP